MEDDEFGGGDGKGKHDSEKSKTHGRLKDVSKKMKLMSHEMGKECVRLKCFEAVPKQIRFEILKQFNSLEIHDLQNSYLCGLITVLPVQHPTQNEDAKKYDTVYNYKVRGVFDGKTKELIVCEEAFMAIHGISEKKVEYLVNNLKSTVASPKDKADITIGHIN